MNSNENKIDFNGRVRRLYITDIIRNNLLNKKDARTIKRWCKEYSVSILKDISGEYVIQQEFDLAYNAPIIEKLKKQYDKNWQTIYPKYISGELHTLIEVKPKATSNIPRYIPKGKVANSFISSKTK